ncbi:oxidoreductase [Skermanella aerolata]|uniref:Oxidoreductase n=1 Tax=Skermanella aerolata TaxID=393310 RepID=A0A512DYZ6_9PROT|nr:aldo/keto reductase [Skermanella aerolata]KJB92118.1 NADP-dependent aryl-alcohol dehydrogenase [Skermanella aerolata KACC 11604]GEO41707.1 oxidoreductase [Skermanella aerolata]
MEKRQLGRSGLEVVPLCFGGNVFGWTIDQPTSHRVLDAFVGEGFNFIDTADMYSRWAPGNSGGESETIIGSWLKGRGDRDNLVIATKVGMEMGPGKKGLAPAYIRASVEDSLRRLQTDYIDLYQSHADDPDTPFEDVLGTYQELIEQGKVRAIGASNISAARLKEALDVSARTGLVRYESLQPEYNLFDRAGYEAELEPLCREHGLGVITYYSLASGFLSGKYRKPEDASRSPRGEGVVSKYLNDKGRAILKALDEVAALHDATPTQVALAWVIARPSVTAPIASATSVEQLKDFAGAAKLKLDQGSISLLDEAGGG